MAAYLCAVDVGTGSARAGIFDAAGKLLGRAEHAIVMNRSASGHSEQIWSAVCDAVRGARKAASVDATCSTVFRGRADEQVGVSSNGEPRWDTIVWLDYRALAEADECTATRHDVLGYAGGVMSPEMATPKLMWVKRHLPHSWARTASCSISPTSSATRHLVHLPASNAR